MAVTTINKTRQLKLLTPTSNLHAEFLGAPQLAIELFEDLKRKQNRILDKYQNLRVLPKGISP